MDTIHVILKTVPQFVHKHGVSAALRHILEQLTVQLLVVLCPDSFLILCINGFSPVQIHIYYEKVLLSVSLSYYRQTSSSCVDFHLVPESFPTLSTHIWFLTCAELLEKLLSHD